MAINVSVTHDAYHRTIAGEIGRVDPTGARYWLLVFAAWVGSPFCQAGLQWALRKLGAAMVPCAFPFYVPSMEQYARKQGAWIGRYGAPRAGDWVIFDFNGVGYGTHIGYLERYNADGTLTCIEFNTSPGAGGSQVNGRGVWRRTRYLSQVRGFVRINYKAPTAAPSPAPTPGLRLLRRGVSGNDVRVLQRGLLAKFPAYAGPIKSSGGADGVFGAGTEGVVKEFQRRCGLAADGIVGPATRAALAKCGIRWW